MRGADRSRRRLVGLALLLASVSWTPGAGAHGGVVEEEDACLLRMGFLQAHFTLYQPEARGAEQFCESLPAAGSSLFVIEYLHDMMRRMTLDFRIIRDDQGFGAFANWDDVAGIADLQAQTVLHRRMPGQSAGVLALRHDFAEPGGYIGIVVAEHPDTGKVYNSVFYFAVGNDGYGLIPLFVGLAVAAQLGFWITTGSGQQLLHSVRARAHRTGRFRLSLRQGHDAVSLPCSSHAASCRALSSAMPAMLPGRKAMSVPSEEALNGLVGRRFPGGVYTIAHWENFLLTECTGAEPLPDGLAHPVALFHMPILGGGTSIKEMFTLGWAESDFSIGIESYDWEIRQPLLAETAYQVGGEVTAADRRAVEGRVFDRIQFRFDLTAPNAEIAAVVTITWHYRRSMSATPDMMPPPATEAAAPAQTVSAGQVAVGDEIPGWVMPAVRPERMRTMAAILRDPNPVHWDPAVVEQIGFGRHTINQGPLGLSYMINMLNDWAGPRSIRRIFMRFPLVVLDGDHITARGRVTGLRQAAGETLADCDIWLQRPNTEPPLIGTATVAIDPG